MLNIGGITVGNNLTLSNSFSTHSFDWELLHGNPVVYPLLVVTTSD